MIKVKFATYIFLSISVLLLICCNNNTKQVDIKEEVIEFISFKKVEFSNLDTSYVFYQEPEEIDCTVTIIWNKSKRQFHIYDDGKGIIDYEIKESSETDDELNLEAKQEMRSPPEGTSNEEKSAIEAFTDYINMMIDKKDSVALLQISNEYFGTVYYMQLK